MGHASDTQAEQPGGGLELKGLPEGQTGNEVLGCGSTWVDHARLPRARASQKRLSTRGQQSAQGSRRTVLTGAQELRNKNQGVLQGR